MADDAHRQSRVKTVSSDPRTKNRLRFSSSKNRASRASADVYRRYKRKLDVGSSASREERVHGSDAAIAAAASSVTRRDGKGKRRRVCGVGGKKGTGGSEKFAVIRPDRKDDDAKRARDSGEETSDDDDDDDLDRSSTAFAAELDLTRDRNVSEIYTHFHRPAWGLCRSLPELLHHSSSLVDLILGHLLSPEGAPGTASPPGLWKSKKSGTARFVVNAATSDLLHLLAVLARDLRGEIHPHVHSRIVPRIVDDLLNPPPPPADSGRQAPPLDVGIVEAAFRCLSYVFRYDSRLLAPATGAGEDKDEEKSGGRKKNGKKKEKKKSKKGKGGDDGDKSDAASSVGGLEPLRRYYGSTLGHRRDYVRRLAAETFSPLVRRLGSDAARSKHLRRVVRALASSAAGAASGGNGGSGGGGAAERAREDAVDGVALLLFHSAKGSDGRLHSRSGRGVIRCAVGCLFPPKRASTSDEDEAAAAAGAAERVKREVTFDAISSFVGRMGSHLGSSDAFAPAWDELGELARASSEALNSTSTSASVSASASAAAVDSARFSARLLSRCVSLRGGVLLREDSSSSSSSGGKNRDENVAKLLSSSLGRLLEERAYCAMDAAARRSCLDLLRAAWGSFPRHSAFAEGAGRYFDAVAGASSSFGSTAFDKGDGDGTAVDGGDDDRSEGEDGEDDGAAELAESLLPRLPRSLALGSLLPRILAAAAKRAENGDSDGAMRLVFAAATARLAPAEDSRDDDDNDDDDDDDEGALFFPGNALDCHASAASRKAAMTVLGALPQSVDESKDGEEEILARVSYAARCVPFLCLLGCGGSGDVADEDSGSKKISATSAVKEGCKWITSRLKFLGKRSGGSEAKGEGADGGKNDKRADSGGVATEALLLEALAVLASELRTATQQRGGNSSDAAANVARKALVKSRPRVKSLLFARPDSLWAVRSASAAAVALASCGLPPLSDDGSSSAEDEERAFESLSPNLSDESHFLRWHSLRILDSFPTRNFASDHADLDLTGDLDEEPSSAPVSMDDDGKDGNGKKTASASSYSSVAGPCPLLSLLLRVESTRPSVQSERSLTSTLSRVEALCRSGRSPPLYAEACAYHLLGLMHVKYAGLWGPAIDALVALATSGRGGDESGVDRVWPSIERRIVGMMKVPPSAAASTSADEGDDSQTSSSAAAAARRHLALCAEWDSSGGRRGYDGLFFLSSSSSSSSSTSTAEEEGRVSRHRTTDSDTVFEKSWHVLERAPRVTSAKSKSIVSVFLEFLRGQYYVFHDDDPDAGELDLDGLHGELVVTCPKWDRQKLSRRSIQKKLISSLKAFAAVNGPRGLYRHGTLLSFFASQLSNPDPTVAKLGLSCVLRYKSPDVAPYSTQLRGLLTRGELRDTLAKFDLSSDAEEPHVESRHREGFIPVLVRILFGRFSARGSGGAKSSKDSPAARRAAILSSLSSLGRGDGTGELDYFVYMMVRVFVSPPGRDAPPPSSSSNATPSIFNKEQVRRTIHAAGEAGTDDVSLVKTAKAEGFLNLLSDVVSHIGFGAKEYVPVFVNLLLSICEHAESLRGGGGKRGDDDDDKKSEEGEEGSGAVVKGEDEGARRAAAARAGNVRSLCLRVLSDLLVKYASAFDFSPYRSRIWSALGPALRGLPGSVVGADRPPALLGLLECLTSHPRLIPLLEARRRGDGGDSNGNGSNGGGNQLAPVEAMFLCIDESSRPKVVDCALRCVDNLLTEGGTVEDFEEAKLSHGRLPGVRLVEQNVHLLIEQFTKRLGSNGAGTAKDNHLVWRELSVLCRVSDLLVSTSAGEAEAERASGAETAEVLESLCGLLVPYLHFDRKVSEDNQKYVLGILKAIMPRIRTDASLSHLQTMSKLLGPNRARAGITNRDIRHDIISVISAIASHGGEGSSLKRVATSLECLCATHPKHIEEYDFDRLLPALNALGNEEGAEDGSWANLAGSSKELGLKPIMPLVYTCFQMLYDSDGVVTRGASKALKTLVAVSFAQSSKTAAAPAADGAGAGRPQNEWVWMIETSFLSCVRTGLSTKEVPVRRSFILLLAEVSRTFASYDSPGLHGDLNALRREDDIELDFFLNATHVQVHRRARALMRLRKALASDNDASDAGPPFSVQSLTNVLLPIATNPVHECRTTAEEPYANEAILTVGAIARHMPWNKYNSALWVALNQVSRNPGQERYIVSMICAIIDSFHFEVVVGAEGDAEADGGSSEGNAVWRMLKNRLIPKIEELLVKETIESGSAAEKSLRAPVALALVKLFQKLPLSVFEAKLPRLLVVICNALRSRDSETRDVARETLAKISASVGVDYLSEVIKELAGMLSEGYQLHVRSAALHSVILAVSKVYKRPASLSDEDVRLLSFDMCVPALMDLIQQDIFGTASEMKEVRGARRRLVKEASGVKSYDTLEIVARSILFRPSLAASEQTREPDAEFSVPPSAVHALVIPLLERLRNPEVDTATIGKVKECLNRVTVGFSHNTSVESKEIFPFVYASVYPFVMGAEVQSNVSDSDSSSDEEEIRISRTGRKKHGGNRVKTEGEANKIEVFQWQPSTLNAPKDSRKALSDRQRDRAELRKVVDGAIAPKLTGSSRYKALESSSSHGLKDPAGASAVSFGLRLLHSCLKKSKIDVKHENTLAMADPYVPMLTKCVEGCSENTVILLSLKCLSFLLKLELPSVPHYLPKLGQHVLKLLTDSGAGSNTKNEIAQGCFKTMTLLMAFDSGGEKASFASNNTDKNTTNANSSLRTLPLDADQMQTLVSIIQSAISDSDHNSPTFGLIKSITSAHYVSSEYYDLMETILKLSLQSQKQSVRQQCCKIFMQYFFEYPMGKQRLGDHMKQLVLNIKYEYEEGRLSALGLLTAVTRKVPPPVLEEHAQLLFLPLVLQLVNDESKKCRETVGEAIIVFLKRLELDTLQSFFDYATRWSTSGGIGSGPLQRTSVQLFGIFIDSRKDFVRRGGTLDDISKRLQLVLTGSLQEPDGEWELHYFSLLCVEKIQKQFPSALARNYDLWDLVIQSLVHPHPWSKQVSSRIINSSFLDIDPVKLASANGHFLVEKPGSLYDIARNLCRQLSAEEDSQVDALSLLAIKNLVWVVRAMDAFPHLCYGDSRRKIDGNLPDPVLWLMTRLSNIAKEPGKQRREALFKCFAAFASSCAKGALTPYLKLMIEPLNRAITEISSKLEQRRMNKRQEEHDETELPKEVLQLLEDQCGTDSFLNALASVQNQARTKRERRKQEIAAEAVHNPEAAAKRRILKQSKEKQRRKRRIQDKKMVRAAPGKKARQRLN